MDRQNPPTEFILEINGFSIGSARTVWSTVSAFSSIDRYLEDGPVRLFPTPEAPLRRKWADSFFKRLTVERPNTAELSEGTEMQGSRGRHQSNLNHLHCEQMAFREELGLSKRSNGRICAADRRLLQAIGRSGHRTELNIL